MTETPSANQALLGLEEGDRQRAAQAFFEGFHWDGAEPDPKTMSAERFFELL